VALPKKLYLRAISQTRIDFRQYLDRVPPALRLARLRLHLPEENFMKAVLALIVIYVGTFLVAIQGASNAPVEASGQSAQQNGQARPIDAVKEADIRSLLELEGAKDSIADSASAASEQYRQKMLEISGSSDRAQAFTNAYLAGFQRKFDASAVNEQLVGIYDKHFSDDEIRGLLEFYGSPLGQKFALEMPKITREVQAATRAAGNQAARQAWLDLRAQYPGADEPPKPFVQRRRNSAGQSAAQSASSQQAAADPSEP
jgi:hypothetical protein